jgi:hypothetical protein
VPFIGAEALLLLGFDRQVRLSVQRCDGSAW